MEPKWSWRIRKAKVVGWWGGGLVEEKRDESLLLVAWSRTQKAKPLS